MEILTLETERLILRPPTMDDWPEYADLMSSQRAIYLGGPHPVKTAWGMFCHDAALWPLTGQGALMFEDRDSGRCLGQVGINSGPLYPEYELGWFVYEHAEGKGYGYEAARAFRDWAFGVRRLETLVSYIAAANIRSRKLAERLGAKLDTQAVRVEPEDVVYRHPNPITGT
jgi:RimJ/RimL family protein N-acetyltransferase